MGRRRISATVWRGSMAQGITGNLVKGRGQLRAARRGMQASALGASPLPQRDDVLAAAAAPWLVRDA